MQNGDATGDNPIMQSLLISAAGIALLLLIAFALSSDRKNIRLRVVGAAFVMQAGIALLVLYVPAGKRVIAAMSQGVSNLLGYAQAGIDFLIRKFTRTEVAPRLPQPPDGWRAASCGRCPGRIRSTSPPRTA